nr:GIY-YIG nuclease family protein [Heyndrickxia ginsengihumi]
MVHKKTKFVEEKYTKGHIYFVRDEATGLVKIGHTKQLERRLRNLANQLPGNIELLHVIEVEKRYTVERSFQHFFAHKNVRSEWYDLSQEDIECLQAGNYPSVAKEYLIAEYCPSEVNISLKTEKRAL